MRLILKIWDLGLILKILDLRLGFGIVFENLGSGIHIHKIRDSRLPTPGHSFPNFDAGRLEPGAIQRHGQLGPTRLPLLHRLDDHWELCPFQPPRRHFG